MNAAYTPLLLLSGPVGVGKSSVGAAAAELLETRQIPHTFIDFDHLRYTFPRPESDLWNNQLGLKNLKAIWTNCEQAGARNLVVSYVIEEQTFVDQLISAVGGARAITVQLTARMDTLEARLKQRESAARLDWHLHRAKELSTLLLGHDVPCDCRIATDGRTAEDVAEEVAAKVNWRLS